VRYVEEVDVDRFDPGRLSFFNINTPEDWEWMQRLLEEQPPFEARAHGSTATGRQPVA
jgi:hypothetical protein